jgi:hypothetical protein
MQGFSTSLPININITQNSLTNSVIIAGSQSFLNSSGVVNITSNQASPVVQISGTLHADAGVNLILNGGLLMSGTGTISGGEVLIQSSPGNQTLALAGTGTITAAQINLVNGNASGLISVASGTQLTAYGNVNVSAPNGSISGNSAANLNVNGSLTLVSNTLTNAGDFAATANTIPAVPGGMFTVGVSIIQICQRNSWWHSLPRIRIIRR